MQGNPQGIPQGVLGGVPQGIAHLKQGVPQPHPHQQLTPQQAGMLMKSGAPGAASGRLQGVKQQVPQPGIPVLQQAPQQQQLQQQQLQQQLMKNNFDENTEFFFTEKQVALGRYIQNHEFLEDIFSPTTVGQCRPSVLLPYAQVSHPFLRHWHAGQIVEGMKTDAESIVGNADLHEKIAKKRKGVEDDIAHMKKKHKETVKSIEDDAAKWTQYMNLLENCSTTAVLFFFLSNSFFFFHAFMLFLSCSCRSSTHFPRLWSKNTASSSWINLKSFVVFSEKDPPKAKCGGKTQKQPNLFLPSFPSFLLSTSPYFQLLYFLHLHLHLLCLLRLRLRLTSGERTTNG